MNNFKKISAVILAFCTAVTLFTSCSKDENPDNTTAFPEENIATEIVTEFVTEKEEVTVKVTDFKGEISVSVSERIVTVPVTKIITTIKNDITDKPFVNTTKNHAETQKQSNSAIPNNPTTTFVQKTVTETKKAVATTLTTTQKPLINDTVNEKSVGISMLTKTDPVQTGNQATIFVQGTPGKTYSIEFYETPSVVASSSSLEDKKADANGFVSWTFKIGSNCNPGKRKLVVKEKNSSNYLETSITVK